MLVSAERGGSEGSSSSRSMTSSGIMATETLITASLRMSDFSCMLMTEEVRTILIALGETCQDSRYKLCSSNHQHTWLKLTSSIIFLRQCCVWGLRKAALKNKGEEKCNYYHAQQESLSRILIFLQWLDGIADQSHSTKSLSTVSQPPWLPAKKIDEWNKLPMEQGSRWCTPLPQEYAAKTHCCEGHFNLVANLLLMGCDIHSFGLVRIVDNVMTDCLSQEL